LQDGRIEEIESRSWKLDIRLPNKHITKACKQISSGAVTILKKIKNALTVIEEMEAFELNRHGEKKNLGKEYLERVARHEAGHAYLCYLG
jgi:hypothetical protein